MLKVIGYTPFNRRDYVVYDDAHKDDTLLEYTRADGEISDVVISIGGGRHRHYPAAQVMQFIDKGRNIKGLMLAPGWKLEVTNGYGKYLEERAGHNPNRIYSLLAGMWDIQLLGISYTTTMEVYHDVTVPMSVITGFRVFMSRCVLNLTLAEMASVCKVNYVPELSVIHSGEIRINSEMIMNRFYEEHSRNPRVGVNYLELVNPDDIITVRDSKL